MVVRPERPALALDRRWMPRCDGERILARVDAHDDGVAPEVAADERAEDLRVGGDARLQSVEGGRISGERREERTGVDLAPLPLAQRRDVRDAAHREHALLLLRLEGPGDGVDAAKAVDREARTRLLETDEQDVEGIEPRQGVTPRRDGRNVVRQHAEDAGVHVDAARVRGGEQRRDDVREERQRAGLRAHGVGAPTKSVW